MKNLELRALVIISLMALALTAFIVPTRNHQGFDQNDQFAMPEPFASGPILSFSYLENSPQNLYN